MEKRQRQIAKASLTLGGLLGLVSLLALIGYPALAPCVYGALVLLAVSAQLYRFSSRDLAARVQNWHGEAEVLRVRLDEERNAIDALADRLDVAVFICDTKANVLYANQCAVDLFRFDGSSGRSILAITLSHELGNMVAESVRARQMVRQELSFSYPEERVAIAKAWPHGERIFVELHDVTDIRRLERIRQDFVANVSHELRTPLTIIRAMAETLLDEMEDADEHTVRYLSKITEEVDRLSLITQDLLILSAAESRMVRKQACDLAEVFRTVLTQLRPKAEAKGLEALYEGPDKLPIEANPSQMRQVAINLIENAINYTAEGSVVVTVSASGASATAAVRDTGLGIASEHLDRIFERFYRIDKGRSRETGGTGLGLSIVRNIVEAHGGTVSVESRLNQGSTFRVVVPVGNL